MKDQRERRQVDEKRRLEERRKRKLAAASKSVDDKRRTSLAGDINGLEDGDARSQLDEDTIANFRPALTEEMDVFSAGCVLAEMWTDGRTVFNLSELFAYRDGALGLEGILENIEDQHVRVSHLVIAHEKAAKVLGHDHTDVIPKSSR